MSSAGLECGNIGCPGLNGAGQIITKGLAGRGCNLLVGFFHLQIRIQKPQRQGRPGGIAGPRPDPAPVVDPQHYDQPRVDPDNVDVFITIKWPFMDDRRRLQFTMKRSWANVVVNRINQINTFNERFKVKIGELKADFKVEIGELKTNFTTKFKKK